MLHPKMRNMDDTRKNERRFSTMDYGRNETPEKKTHSPARDLQTNPDIWPKKTRES